MTKFFTSVCGAIALSCLTLNTPLRADDSPEVPASQETGDPASEAHVVAAAPVDPQLVRLNLMDGSLLTGKIEIKELELETRFGKLQIPIEAIKSFQPGLESYPELQEEIDTLIAELGSDEFASREAARKRLQGMGGKVELELKRYLDTGVKNAEQTRQIRLLLEEIAQNSEDADASNQPWSRLDVVETTDFTVSGKISPRQFQVSSQYGPLNIQLAHIRLAQRNFSTREELRKSLSVDGQNLAQLNFKNSDLRLSQGDQVSITADGTLIMTPWGGGSVSTPEGSQNYGIYQDQIWGGALIARIGENGKIFKVGSKHSFTADRSGQLQFAVAMQHEYAQGNYQFPGKYNLKIKVEPK